ncbi:hypothetical protein V1527DRAFT_474597 [Lipomyces starkeyi]
MKCRRRWSISEKYRANREDIVTSTLVTARPESSCSRYVSCQNHESARYFGEVDRLFSCTWRGKDHQLALVKVFDEVRYTSNKMRSMAKCKH